MPYELATDVMELDFEQVEAFDGKTIDVGQTSVIEKIPVKTLNLKNVVNAFYTGDNISKREKVILEG